MAGPHMLDGAAPARLAPTPHPLLHPQPMLLPIFDANALLVMGCHMVKTPGLDLVTQLAMTGRGTPHVAAHIPGEIRRHLRRLAEHNEVDPFVVARVLDRAIMPSARVVDLELRDHLGPGAWQILHVDRDLPRDNRGDPDDMPTMALAEFLAPTVIVSQDSVFARFGFAAAALEWIPLAKNLLRMVGIEASTADAVLLAELAMRLFGGSVGALVSQVRRHPWIAAGILAAALWFARDRGFLRVERWREKSGRVWEAARPFVDKAAEALIEQANIREALIVVEAPPYPVPEQISARHLARAGRSLTPAELRDGLRLRGVQIPATQLERAMRGHGGFTREPGNRYAIGRPARLLIGRRAAAASSDSLATG